MKKLFIWRTVWSNSWWHYRPQSANTNCSMRGTKDKNKQHHSTATLLGPCARYESTWWSEGMAPLISKLRWVVSFRPRPHIPLGKNLTYLLNRSGLFADDSISTLTGTQPRLFSRPAHKTVTTTDWRTNTTISTSNRPNVDRTVCTGHLTSIQCWMYCTSRSPVRLHFVLFASLARDTIKIKFLLLDLVRFPRSSHSRLEMLFTIPETRRHASASIGTSERAETIRRHVTSHYVYC